MRDRTSITPCGGGARERMTVARERASAVVLLLRQTNMRSADMRATGSSMRYCMAAAIVAIAIAPRAYAAKYSSDTVPASGGEIRITPINHATLMLEYGGKVIGVDPTGQGDYTDLPKPDVILITD